MNAQPPQINTLVMPDGEQLAVQDFAAASAQVLRGQIVLVHGLGEHMGRYAHVVERLTGWGFAVRCYDHYGHGKSSGARGCLASPNRLLDDLGMVIDDTRKNMSTSTPLILLGHSMGGLVAARFVSLKMRAVDALVLSSPALGAKLSGFQKFLLATLPHVAPNLAVANGLDVNKISHDAAVVKAYLADPLVHNRISPRLGKFIFDNGTRTIEKAAQWSVPTLLMYAGQDALVDPAASLMFTGLAPSGILQSTCYEQLYHEIFNEVDSSPVFAELETWLKLKF